MIKKTVFLVAASLLLSACSERDVAYYQANPDKAELKAEECMKIKNAAFMANDGKRLKEIQENKECIAAVEVYEERRREQRAAESKKRKIEREALQAQKEAQYQLDLEAFVVEFAGLPIEDFYPLVRECTRTIGRTAKCEAVKRLEDDKVGEELGQLIKTYPREQLLDYREEQCDGVMNMYDDTACSLAHQASARQDSEITQNYLDNPELLKADFNACQSQISKFRAAGRMDKGYEYAERFECTQVSKAARNIGVYDFRNPMK